MKDELLEAALSPRTPAPIKSRLIQIAKREAETEVSMLTELEALMAQLPTAEDRPPEKAPGTYDDLGDD